MDRRLMLMENFSPWGVVCPCPGAIYMYISIIMKHLLPALATCETSQVLLAGVSGVFSRGSPVFAPPTDWPVSYELK